MQSRLVNRSSTLNFQFALSCISGKNFAVRTADRLSNAESRLVEVVTQVCKGSRYAFDNKACKLVFKPGKVSEASGTHDVDCRDVDPLFIIEPLILIGMFCEKKLKYKIRGTYLPELLFELLNKAVAPLVAKFGVRLDITLTRYGIKLIVHSMINSVIPNVDLNDFGKVSKVRVALYYYGGPNRSLIPMRDGFMNAFSKADVKQHRIRITMTTVSGHQNHIGREGFVYLRTFTGCRVALTTVGAENESGFQRGKKMGKELLDLVEARCVTNRKSLLIAVAALASNDLKVSKLSLGDQKGVGDIISDVKHFLDSDCYWVDDDDGILSVCGSTLPLTRGT